MRKLFGGLVFAALVIAALFAIGPREPVNVSPRFQAESLPADPDAYLAAEEQGIRPDIAKRILWAGARGA